MHTGGFDSEGKPRLAVPTEDVQLMDPGYFFTPLVDWPMLTSGRRKKLLISLKKVSD